MYLSTQDGLQKLVKWVRFRQGLHSAFEIATGQRGTAKAGLFYCVIVLIIAFIVLFVLYLLDVMCPINAHLGMSCKSTAKEERS
jgi:hypothetical protein